MKKAKYFSAVWCGPCKVFKPIMKELSDEGYDIEFIDGDENQDLAVQYNIRSVPTTIIEEDGKIEVTCKFCKEDLVFNEEEIEKALQGI